MKKIKRTNIASNEMTEKQEKKQIIRRLILEILHIAIWIGTNIITKFPVLSFDFWLLQIFFLSVDKCFISNIDDTGDIKDTTRYWICILSLVVLLYLFKSIMPYMANGLLKLDNTLQELNTTLYQ